MAKVSVRLVDVPVTKIEQKLDGVTLELSDLEARVLAQVLAAVGGSPLQTARGIAQGIMNALDAAGYSFVCNYDRSKRNDKPVTEGSVYFTAASLEVFK